MLRVLGVVCMLQPAAQSAQFVHEPVGDHKQPVVL
jgi:hypothetical protein